MIGADAQKPNVGSQPISFGGGNFADGQPFAAYAFAPEMVNPQEYVILTENVAEFKTQYGNVIPVFNFSAGTNFNFLHGCFPFKQYTFSPGISDHKWIFCTFQLCRIHQVS